MSPQARLLRALLRGVLLPLMRHSRVPGPARRRFALAARAFFHAPRGTGFSTEVLAGPALRVLPAGAQATTGPDGVVLYFHGGAYLTGSPATHRAMLARLLQGSGLPALLPQYRLAPEHPFPAAFDDALASVAALRERGIPPERIVLGGDSAGGGLALALLSHLCRQGTPPAGLFAFSPWTDLTFSGPSATANASHDQYLPAERLTEVREMVLQGADPADPRISPLFAGFPDAPPVLLHVAETEMLRDDTLRMKAPLPQADIRLAGDLPHVWPIFHNYLPEARATLAETARFIRSCLDRS